MKNIQGRPSTRSLSRLVHGPLLAALAFCASPADAFEFDTGNPDAKIRWDNTFKYSTIYRLRNPSASVTEGSNQSPAGPNPMPVGTELDDGDRNFKRGIVSNRLDWLSELDGSYKNVGFRASAAAWYDNAYMHGNDNNSDTINTNTVGAGSFDAGTRHLMGRKAELLDAFVYLKSDADSEHPFTIRAGRHSVLYGETLFFGANGIANAQAPIDVVKLLQVPGSQFKEIIRPVGQLSTQVALTPQVSAGAYWQWEWEKSRLPASGSFLSSADFIGDGAETLFPYSGPLAMDRAPDQKPHTFQGGMQLRLKPGDGDVEYGLYAAQYSEKTPMIYMNPALIGGNSTYHLVYPDRIKTVGASFSTVVGDANVAGELSYRWNAPIVSGPQLDPGLTGNGDNNPLYAVGRTLHANLSTVYLFGNSKVWDGASLLGELAWNRRVGIDRNPQAMDPNVTKDAWAMRVLFSPQYFQVLPQLDVEVPIGLGVNIAGRSSAVGNFNGGAAHGGDLSIGVKGEYQKRYTFALNYNHFFGRANTMLTPNSNPNYPATLYMLTGAQALYDRDFISFTMQTTF